MECIIFEALQLPLQKPSHRLSLPTKNVQHFLSPRNPFWWDPTCSIAQHNLTCQMSVFSWSDPAPIWRY